MTRNAFISYQSSDLDFAHAVAVELEARGIHPWVDRHELPAGADLIAELGRALEKADHVIVFASQAYLDAEWTSLEWRTALALRLEAGHPRIIIVRPKAVPLPPLLRPTLWVEWTAPAEVAARICHALGEAEVASRRRVSWRGLPRVVTAAALKYVLEHLHVVRASSQQETWLMFPVDSHRSLRVRVHKLFARDTAFTTEVAMDLRLARVHQRTVVECTAAYELAEGPKSRARFAEALEEAAERLAVEWDKALDHAEALCPDLEEVSLPARDA